MADEETIDTSRPHSARMYDYYLGGKDWFEADKQAAEAAIAFWPHAAVTAQQNRYFMHRATRVLARDYGVRQFLDLGTGIPTAPNLHQIAQEVAPDAKVVYLDNDPLVLEYASALLRSTPEGHTAYVEADVREVSLGENQEVHEVLDFEQPIALSLIALTHFFPDDWDPHAMVERFLAPLPSGSFLVLSHATPDFEPEIAEKVRQLYLQSGTPVQFRAKAEIERFFDGLELVEPGVTTVHRWRPEEPSEYSDYQVSFYGGVARKP
ncbi:SAM-dependent methyltransferase [Streptomyces sulphureus]|uniref:SAM-dependent methyltransferase n=1 Tax=Streptomyces sulphureus TaxID=47758 RepID=UPI000367CEF6|nr:SAM-dependent methyltransferase [Streptomyces sulphureus]